MESAIVPIRPQKREADTIWAVTGGLWSLARSPSDLSWVPGGEGIKLTTLNREVIDATMNMGLSKDLKFDHTAARMYFPPVIQLFLRRIGIISKSDFAEYERCYEETFAAHPRVFLRHKLSDRADLIAEASLWEAVFHTLEAINRSGQWDFDYPVRHPAHALADMVQDRLLIGFLKADIGTLSADAYIRQHRGITQELRNGGDDRANPFPEESTTHKFVDISHELLDQDDNQNSFREKYWLPIIKARTRLINIVAKSKPKRMDSDTLNPVNSQARAASKRTRGRQKKF